jgi:PASTA domain
MRFLLGVLVGYSVRGKQKLLIKVLVTLLVVYVILLAVVLPTIALLALSLDVQRERRSRPAQTKVPLVKGLTYEDAERKLHIAHLNIRLLATRYDPAVQPGLIIDQTPTPGEEVACGILLGLPRAKRISPALVHEVKASANALDQTSHTLGSWRIRPPCLLIGSTLQSFLPSDAEVLRNHFL